MEDLKLLDYDAFLYLGPINMDGYYRLCNALKNKKKDNAILCLVTFGGDPNAGFRIGRAMQHHYNGNVAIYIPGVCKSAGTLTAICAKHIIINNKGELGPLDIQLRKDEELGVSNSGLDIFKTLDTLEDRANIAFNKYLSQIRFGRGLSTRMSADIASKLVESIIKPIAEQIDPIKIGEHQRATDIAIEYGKRLNETSQCLKNPTTSLNQLIRGYPSHGFVIDRKEAKTIFSCISPPNEDIIERFEVVHNVLESEPDIAAHQLFVEYIQEKDAEEVENESANTERKSTIDTDNQATTEDSQGISGANIQKPIRKSRRNSKKTPSTQGK